MQYFKRWWWLVCTAWLALMIGAMISQVGVLMTGMVLIFLVPLVMMLVFERDWRAAMARPDVAERRHGGGAGGAD